VRVKGSFASEGAQIVTGFRLVFCGAPTPSGHWPGDCTAGGRETDLALGVSLTLIDPHYSHGGRDGGEHAIRLLDDLRRVRAPTASHDQTIAGASWMSSSSVR
jgi:hypothetical protein